MELLQIGRARVRVHPAFFLVALAAAAMGRLPELLLSLLGLVLHELCHAVAAWALGYRICAMELLPFGAVIRLEGEIASPLAEGIVAAAGPACSMLLASAAGAALYYLPVLPQEVAYFARFNLLLGILNSLPALPLDGGRILRAALSLHLPPRPATLIPAALSLLLSLTLLGAGIFFLLHGGRSLFALVMGAFLLPAAIREIRGTGEARLRADLKRRDMLRRGETLRVHHLAVSKDATVADALRACRSDRCNVILVLDRSMVRLGTLDEAQLVRAAAKKNGNSTLESLLKH